MFASSKKKPLSLKKRVLQSQEGRVNRRGFFEDGKNMSKIKKSTKQQRKEAKIASVFILTKRYAKWRKLSVAQAHNHIGKVRIEVEYKTGGIQCTSLNPSTTALSIKKGDTVLVAPDKQYTYLIGNILFNGRILKAIS